MIPIYRFQAAQNDNGYNSSMSRHDKPIREGQGWGLQGVTFGAPLDSDPRAVPLFRFHLDQSKTYGGQRYNYCTSMKPLG